MLPPSSGSPARRARRSRDRLTVAAAVALIMGLMLGGGGWALAMRGTGCDGPGQWLSVTADPALAPAALAAADRFNAARREAGDCAAVKVAAADSGEIAGVFRDGRGTPDVWIPDSSLWPDLVGKARAGRAPSVASSPVVFAMPNVAANRHHLELERRSWGAFLPEGGGTSPDAAFRLQLPDPARTGTGMAALLALQASSGAGRGALGRFTTMLRTAKTLPYGKGVDAAFDDADTSVVAVSEQVVWRHNRFARNAGRRVATIYPSAGTPYLDFPFVVTTADAGRRRVAERFLAELRTARAVADLRQIGLRGSGGADGSANAAPVAGTEPIGGTRTSRDAPRALPVARPGAAAEIQETWRKLGQGLNVLALVDPSGRASEPMPPSGSRKRGQPEGTRLDAMRKALSTGFTLVPDNSSFGLWTLSGTTLDAPYRKVLPMRELGARTPDARNQRLRLQEAVSGVRARPGRQPGLFDAIDAAYSEVERNYRSNELNIVLVLTAGGPHGPHGKEREGVERTVRRLRGAFDAKRPVSVVVLGFGADADPALREVAAATDGGTYKIDNPGTVMRLFLRTDQLRVCDHPRCPD
ncbi:substrate-binding and VWA domain-containing protein [Actinomadura terrae]|uniref:substrate-binding and VWA domain-containing protein n=1 Tax=Actinomadura terrae TaxID=604353 RepID=UPI001FA7F145|nr:substrate-binding and VWA domain-containing protein [Actinomadura terrae]